MTGMLGVGIGEVVIPQLVKKNGVPLPVAAGTSVLVVFLNAVGEPEFHCRWMRQTRLFCFSSSRLLTLFCGETAAQDGGGALRILLGNLIRI